jgi:hypothetical protein
MLDRQETDEPRPDRGSSAPALCIGESLLDLICERLRGARLEGGAGVLARGRSCGGGSGRLGSNTLVGERNGA